MEVARTSMIHAAAPQFLWPFAVRYVAEQLNLWPRVSHPETSPTLQWTGEVGDASAFRVWGSLSLVRNLPAGKLSPRTLRCVFLGFPTDAPPWQFYHPGSRRVLSSRDVTFDESVCFYHLHPHRSSPSLLALRLDCLHRRSCGLAAPVDSGAARGGDIGGADSGGAGSGGAASPTGARGAAAGVSAGGGAGGAGTGGAGARGTVSGGTGTTGGTGGVAAVGAAAGIPGSHRQESLSLERLHEWAVRWGSPGGGAGRAGAAGSGGAGPGGASAGVPVVGRARGTGSGGTGATGGTGGAAAVGAVAVRWGSPGGGGGCVGAPGSGGVGPGGASAGVPRVGRAGGTCTRGTGATGGAIGGTGVGGATESDLVRAASPTVTRLLASVVTGPSFESAAASALVAELVDFAALCRLDYAASLVFDSSCPPSVGCELALGCDVLEDRQFELECLAAAAPHLASTLLSPEGDLDALDIPTPRTYADAITGPYSSQWQIAMDAEMASWKSTGTYIDEVPPPGANIVDGTWIFRVKRPPGSPPAFKARYVARSFRQREGVDFFHTFSPTPKMTTLWVLLHVAAQRDYEPHSLDFSIAFLQDSLHEAIWLRSPRGFTGTTLAALGFAPSTADPSLFLRTDTSLLPFYVLVYVHDLDFATTDSEALALVKAELQKRHTCADLGPSAFRLHVVLAIVHSSLYRPLALSSTFGRVPAKRVLRYLCSTSGMGLVLGGQGSVVLTNHSDASWADDLRTYRSTRGCEAEIYYGAMDAQELCSLTYLLTDLGERPRSPPVLYLEQRGQLRLDYVATQANTANVFTKALGSSDHQRFCTALGLVPTLPHLLVS
ncbi:unnamed protein product [Closterium sp. NIES-53]